MAKVTPHNTTATPTADNSATPASVVDYTGEEVSDEEYHDSSSSALLPGCCAARVAPSASAGAASIKSRASTGGERARGGESMSTGDSASGSAGTAGATINGALMGDSRWDFSTTTHSRSHSAAFDARQHCRICFSEACDGNSSTDMRECGFCEHRTCKSCFAAWIKAQVNMGKAEITCPSCDVSIPPCDLSEHVSPETLRKLEYYKSRREHSRNPHAVWCAENTCRELLATTPATDKKKKADGGNGNGNKNELVCARCETKTCQKCYNVAHEGVRCKKPRRTHYGTAKNAFWKRFHARKCPECHIWIEKDGGCSEMECTNCTMSFCFRCGTGYYRINLAGRTIDGCRCIRMRKNSLRVARAGVFAISFPFLVVALGIGIPAAALLYYASSNDKREVADRVIEEFFKHSGNSNASGSSFRHHIQHLVDRGLSDESSTSSADTYSNLIDSEEIANTSHTTEDVTEVTSAQTRVEEEDGIVEAQKATVQVWGRMIKPAF